MISFSPLLCSTKELVKDWQDRGIWEEVGFEELSYLDACVGAQFNWANWGAMILNNFKQITTFTHLCWSPCRGRHVDSRPANFLLFSRLLEACICTAHIECLCSTQRYLEHTYLHAQYQYQGRAGMSRCKRPRWQADR